jgi:hypothetical protein
MDYCQSLNLPVIEHAEDISLAHGAVMREAAASGNAREEDSTGGQYWAPARIS